MLAPAGDRVAHGHRGVHLSGRPRRQHRRQRRLFRCTPKDAVTEHCKIEKNASNFNPFFWSVTDSTHGSTVALKQFMWLLPGDEKVFEQRVQLYATCELDACGQQLVEPRGACRAGRCFCSRDHYGDDCEFQCVLLWCLWNGMFIDHQKKHDTFLRFSRGLSWNIQIRRSSNSKCPRHDSG